LAISKTFPTEGCLSPVVEKKKKTFLQQSGLVGNGSYSPAEVAEGLGEW